MNPEGRRKGCVRNVSHRASQTGGAMLRAMGREESWYQGGREWRKKRWLKRHDQTVRGRTISVPEDHLQNKQSAEGSRKSRGQEGGERLFATIAGHQEKRDRT